MSSNIEKLDKKTLLTAAYQLKKYPELVVETPIIHHAEQRLKSTQNGCPDVKNLILKLENMQITGSFKIRGATNQFHNLSGEAKKRPLVTMSAGNYGFAFAQVAKKNDCEGVVFMPDDAPLDRKATVEKMGAVVQRVPRGELLANIQRHQKEYDSTFMHPFDDLDLIAGNASAGFEILKNVEVEPDMVVICCGGGGLLAGVAAALRLSGWKKTKIYGVEPETAATMHASMKCDKPMKFEVGPTICTGLAPPHAGVICYDFIKKYTSDILLVSDEEIQSAMQSMYEMGLIVEPSGAAAVAAILSEKIPTAGKTVVAIVTGGNVSPTDLAAHVTGST